MYKKLISIGIAAALTAPMIAYAGAEVYGDARISVDVSDNGGSSGNEKTKGSVGSNASRIGFRGDEDLGDGMSAIWQFEQGVDFDSGTWMGDQRPSFVGLSGGFGTIMAGRFDTPYMSATDKYDIFIDTKADYNAIMGATPLMKPSTPSTTDNRALFDQRVSNTLYYSTPDLGGFKANMAWVMSDATNPSSSGDSLPISTPDAKKDSYSLSATYDNGPVSFAAALQSILKMNVGSSVNNITAWKAGGSYTIKDATTLALVYENIDLGGAYKDRNDLYVSLKHRIGNTTIKLAFANADKCGGSDTKCDASAATQGSVGVTQSLSKNTEIYALYSQVSNDSTGSYDLAYGPANVIAGKDESVLSFGINHKFSSK